MKLTKVIYQFGNNQQFDYYILDRKENAIEKDIKTLLEILQLTNQEVEEK